MAKRHTAKTADINSNKGGSMSGNKFLRVLEWLGLVEILKDFFKSFATNTFKSSFNIDGKGFDDNVLFKQAELTIGRDEQKRVRDFLLELKRLDEENSTEWQQNFISFIATFIDRKQGLPAKKFLQAIADPGISLDEQLKECEAQNIFAPPKRSRQVLKSLSIPKTLDELRKEAENFKKSA